MKNGNVVNAADRFNARREAAQDEACINHFKALFDECTADELAKIYEALATGNQDEFLRYTAPIVARKAVKDFRNQIAE